MDKNSADKGASKMFTIYWIAQNQQATLPMGEFESQVEAETGIAKAKETLLAECTDAAQRESIELGTWSIEEIWRNG